MEGGNESQPTIDPRPIIELPVFCFGTYVMMIQVPWEAMEATGDERAI